MICIIRIDKRPFHISRFIFTLKPQILGQLQKCISRYVRDCNSDFFMCFCERTFLFCNDDNKTSKVEKLFRDQTKNSKENPTSIISAPLHEFQYRKIACILICINWKQGNKIHNTFLKNHFSTCYSKHFFHNVSII